LESSELGALYQRYGFYVQQRCRLVLGNAVDAEDATQEVFMRVQKYHASLTAPVTLAWLYTIATRCCLDRVSRKGRELPTEPARLVELDGRTSGAPGEADRRAVVSRLLAKVDTKARHIALLHHLEGWTQDEVAEQTGFSRKTVGKKLAQFETLLRDELAQAERWLR
jgi:RNA polymerase sigma-70 factor (ECF subfamily)